MGFYSADWKRSARQSGGSIQPEKGHPERAGEDWRQDGTFRVPGGQFRIHEEITRKSSDEFFIVLELSSPSPIPTGLVSWNIKLPVGKLAGYSVGYDGQSLLLPAKPPAEGDINLLMAQEARRLRLPMREFDLEITGDFSFSMLDTRSISGNSATYIVRIHSAPSQGMLTRTRLALTIRRLPAGPVPEEAKSFVHAPSENWKALDFPRTVKPGSILDFSHLSLDGPAGKYGRTVVLNGHFEFADRPDVPVRFLGVNLCFGANFPEREEAERLTQELAMIGYNAVRFHLMDGKLTRHEKDPEYLTLNAELLDRNDYFWSCLKKRGFYISTDLYCIRRQNVNGKDAFHNPVKMNLLLDDDAMHNQERFTEKLFSHVNPYTGMARKDDPALIGISLINEDSFRFILPAGTPLDSPVRQQFDAAFQAWDRDLPPVPNPEGRFVEFIMQRGYQRLGGLLNQLGCRALLTDQNCHTELALTVLRNTFDYVDNHNYHDHQTYPEKRWSYPMAFRNVGAVAREWGGSIRDIMATRIFGKPFTVSEYNFCFPNRFRAECGVVYGAYAALQDWDALFRYNYSERYPIPGPGRTGVAYDLHSDPMQMLSEKLVALLFLRGDVRRSELRLPIQVRPDVASRLPTDRKCPATITFAGLIGQLGSVVSADPDPAFFFDSEKAETIGEWTARLKELPDLNHGELDESRRRVRSSTGEIFQHGKAGLMTVITPRTEALLRCDQGDVAGNRLKMTNHGKFVLLSASAMDGKSLAESNCILLLHLTNSANTGTRFANRTMTRLEAPGEYPVLLRRGIADVQFSPDGAAPVHVYAVGMDGVRLREVPVTQAPGGKVRFTLDTHAGESAVAVYELVRGQTTGPDGK